MAKAKSKLDMVNDVLSALPLEQRIKEPMYLKIIGMKVTARMQMFDRMFGVPQYHQVTSMTGHFGPAKREGKVYPS